MGETERHRDEPTSRVTHGVAILTGILFGVTMFLNVWGIIWRNQKIVIGSAEAVAGGGEANPDAAAAAKSGAGRRAPTPSSRITMLWFMVFAAHGALVRRRRPNGARSSTGSSCSSLWAFVEASALGFIGGLDSPFNKLVFDDHKKTIIGGFVCLAVIYFVGWELLLAR